MEETLYSFYTKHSPKIIDILKEKFPNFSENIQLEYEEYLNDNTLDYIGIDITDPDPRFEMHDNDYFCNLDDCKFFSKEEVMDMKSLSKNSLPKYFVVEHDLEISKKLYELYPQYKGNIEFERQYINSPTYKYIGRTYNYPEFETQTQEWFGSEVVRLSKKEFWDLINNTKEEGQINPGNEPWSVLPAYWKLEKSSKVCDKILELYRTHPDFSNIREQIEEYRNNSNHNYIGWDTYTPDTILINESAVFDNKCVKLTEEKFFSYFDKPINLFLVTDAYKVFSKITNKQIKTNKQFFKF